MKPAAVLLDRDGVINEDSPNYIKSAAEWMPIPGSLEAIAHLTALEIPIAICTNQAGIARGKFKQDDLAAIHSEMIRRVRRAGGAIRLIRYCPHHPDRLCGCRKPEPGMLIDACRELDVEPKHCWFVGDSVKDLLAARAAGCKPILVRTGNGEQSEQSHRHLAEAVFDDLLSAVSDV